jgi:5-methylcytosine-specific restriction endonuclease McrA
MTSAPRPSSTRLGYTAQFRQLRKWVLQRDHHRCVLCGSTDHVQVGHIVPLSRGGANVLGNLRATCRRCNLCERDMPPSWKQRAGTSSSDNRLRRGHGWSAGNKTRSAPLFPAAGKEL